MNLNKNLTKYLHFSRKSFALTIASGSLAAVAIVFQAYLLSNLINGIFLLNKSVADQRLPLIMLFVLALCKALFVWGEEYFSAVTVAKLKEKIRRQILSKISRISPVFLKEERTGELTNTMLNGVDTLEKYFGQYMPQLFLSAIIPVLILIFVFPIDILSGAIFIITAPLIPLFMYLIGSAAESINKKQWKTLSRMSAFFWEALQGLTTLKLFNKSKDTLERIHKISDDFRRTTMNVLRIAFLSALVLEVLSTLSIAIIAVEIGLRLLNGNIEFVDAFFILIIAPEFYNPVRQLGARYHAGLEGIAAYERIEDFLNAKEIISGKASIERADFSSNIIIKDVSFTYTGRKIEAVKNLSFTIEPNKITALIGKTGSGKSTIMNMMLKFITPTKGTIKINGKDLSDINKDVWLKNIAWVPQAPHIFYKTIYENIKIAKPEADDNEIFQAAKDAHIHDRILQLPNGYNTIAGENASKLSGGEIQRIALARAFLKSAPLLFIDEPTGNLDPLTEEKILDALEKLMKNKTVLLIAHRKNTIFKADNIVILEEGRVKRADTLIALRENGIIQKELYSEYD